MKKKFTIGRYKKSIRKNIKKIPQGYTKDISVLYLKIKE